MSCTYYINKHDGVKGGGGEREKKSGGAGKRFIKTSQGKTDEPAGKKKKRNDAARILSLLPPLSSASSLNPQPKGVAACLPLACELRRRGGDLALPPSSRLTHIPVCPRGSSSKEPGPGRQAGPSAVRRGQPLPWRNLHGDLISFSYSPYSPDHPHIFT